MFDISVTEFLGYFASCVIMFSFLVKDFIKFRMVNSVGAILFILYGIYLDFSWPIIITNTFILGVNAVFVFKHFSSKQKQNFE